MITTPQSAQHDFDLSFQLMMRTGLWIMVFLPMGLGRGAVWCGVKREVHQCKECALVPRRAWPSGYPSLPCLFQSRAQVILAPFQWYCRQLFLFGDHTAKKEPKRPWARDCACSCTTACSLQLPWCLAILFVWGALGKSIRKKLSNWRLKEMHPILVLYFAFKEEGRAIEKRKKSYQW